MPKRGTIGIDLGGTKTLFALFDEKFNVVQEVKMKTQADKGEKKFTEGLTEAVETLVGKAKKEDLVLVGVGMGCAGFIDPKTGALASSPNIPFIKDYPFNNRLAKLTGANVVIGNDVQVGLYGEHQLGAAAGYSHAIGVFLGTGVGAALIIDGKLHRGASGAAGEFGHFLLQPIGPMVGSERHGILDDVAGRHSIAGDAAVLAAKQWAPYLFKEAGTDVTKIRSSTLADSIKNGDKPVEELVRSRARLVGIALSNLVNFISPEIVVLGGGVVEAMPQLMLKEVEQAMREFLIPAVDKSVKVAIAKLKDHAITTGAAKMAADKFASNEAVGKTAA